MSKVSTKHISRQALMTPSESIWFRHAIVQLRAIINTHIKVCEELDYLRSDIEFMRNSRYPKDKVGTAISIFGAVVALLGYYLEISWLMGIGVIITLYIGTIFIDESFNLYRMEQRLERLEDRIWHQHQAWALAGGSVNDLIELSGMLAKQKIIDWLGADYNDWWMRVLGNATRNMKIEVKKEGEQQ